MTTAQTIRIRKAGRADLAVLHDMAARLRAVKETDYYERNFDEQDQGRRELFIAEIAGQAAGYCILNWEPKYGFFKKSGIPETQDLNVLSTLRNRGIGTALIKHCETRAREKGCRTMGISVGLHGAFGPAQILYAKLGYIPDGCGVTYDRQYVSSGEFRAVDDNLCLMMTKAL